MSIYKFSGLLESITTAEPFIQRGKQSIKSLQIYLVIEEFSILIINDKRNYDPSSTHDPMSRGPPVL